MTAKTELELLKEAGERMVQRMKDDPAYAKKFLRQIMGPPKRKLEGSEREHMLTISLIQLNQVTIITYGLMFMHTLERLITYTFLMAVMKLK